jgi:multiple sugar transport system substrate-binding protein
MNRKVLVLSVTLICAIAAFAFAAGGQEAPQATEITVQMQDHSATRVMQDLLPEFEAKTGIKVNLVILPFSAMKEKQLIELTSRSSTYDVIGLDYRDVAGYGEAGWMVDINSYINSSKADPNLNMKDFLPTSLQGLRWKGKLNGFPFYVESTMLMFRKDLYQKQGLSVPDTWDQLYQNALKLNADTNGDGKIDFYGFTIRGRRAVGYNDYIWNGYLKSYGGSYFDSNWKPVFNSPAGLQALQMYVKMLKDCGPPDAATQGYEEVMQTMMQGKTAQVIDATMLGAWLEDPKQSKVVGLNGWAMVPKGTTRRGNSFFLMGVGIPTFSKKQDAAYKFIEWATSYDIQKQQVDLGAYMTRSSIIQSDAFRKAWPFADIMLQSLADSQLDYTPILPEWAEVAEQVSIAVSSALIGEKTAKAALDEAAANVDKIMKNAGYYK